MCYSFIVLGLLCLPMANGAVLEQFSIYTKEISLRPGEVHNRGLAPVQLPQHLVRRFAGRRMAIAGYDADIVRFDGSQEHRAPLTDMYNHHQYLVLGTNETIQRVSDYYSRSQSYHDSSKSAPCGSHAGKLFRGIGLDGTNFGGGSGGEFRNTDHFLPAPYRYVVESPQSFIFFLHVVNTKGLDGKRLIECPCTSARIINVMNGTIDGVPPDPFYCNKELLEQHNSACSLATYTGGLRCCAHGVFLTEYPDYEATADKVYAKFTFHFEDAGPDTRAASIAGCCDVVGDSSNLGANFEYDITSCGVSERHDCVHMATTIQMIDMFLVAPADPAWNHTAGKPDDVIELVWAYGHQHIGGLGMELYDDSTGELLCESLPKYGQGAAAGDEKGYVVAMSVCTWGPPPLRPPPRLRRDQKVRIIARYNSTFAHRGVMSQWQISKVDVRESSSDLLDGNSQPDLDNALLI